MATFPLAQRAPLVRRQSGLECEFVHPPPDYLQTECSVCLLVLRSPHITSCCGHNFCKTCIDEIQTGGKACPLCNQLAFSLVYNRSHDASLKQLDAYCPYRKISCKWIGKLDALDEHLNRDPEFTKQLVGCAFVEVRCYHDGCGQFVQRQIIIEHQTEKCSKRPFVCEYCHDYSSTHDDVLRHWAVCICYPISCPHKCTQNTFERRSLQRHLDEECPLQEIECSFKYAGCRTKLPRRDMAAHVKENVTHMSLLALQNQQLLTKLNDKEEEIRRAMEENRMQIEGSLDRLVQNQLKQLHQKEDDVCRLYQTHMERLGREKDEQVEKLEGDLIQLKQNMEMVDKSWEPSSVKMDLASRIGELELKTRAVCKQLEHRVTKVQDSINKVYHHVKIAPIQLTMTKFAQHKSDRDDWFSKPFYTHPQGYKVCLNVVANGDISGIGTHVSCFIYLVRGEFDNHLTWPFRGEFTVQLLNQRENSNHHTTMFSFNDSTPNKVAGRVVGIERAVVGWGNPTFVHHHKIYNNTASCQYLAQNHLYFRVSCICFSD